MGIVVQAALLVLLRRGALDERVSLFGGGD